LTRSWVNVASGRGFSSESKRQCHRTGDGRRIIVRSGRRGCEPGGGNAASGGASDVPAIAGDTQARLGTLQRQVPRRVSESQMVSFAPRGEGADRKMAPPLQRSTPAFEPRLSHAGRICGSRSKTSAPSCNGPGRCGTWGLRAPARCSTVPSGTHAANQGSRLKLKLVRRNRAGHSDPVSSTEPRARIALAAQPAPNLPRLRALALFGRRSPERAEPRYCRHPKTCT
jgi:hypothetical protein